MSTKYNPADFHYYSDMYKYEFAGANRSKLESLGAKDFDECLALGEEVFSTLPDKPRPYVGQ